MTTLALGQEPLTPGRLWTAVQERPRLEVTRCVLDRLERAKALVTDASRRGAKVYGLSTGVGSQKRFNVVQDEDELERFNRELVLDHAGGVGDAFPEALSYAIALTRLHLLALGGSGLSPGVFTYLVDRLNRGIVPVLPRWGSVGASDLSACAALAAAWLFGEGHVYWRGDVVPARELAAPAPRLAHKDALALLNANAVSFAIGSYLVEAGRRLSERLFEVAALSMEAFGANPEVLDPVALRLRAMDGADLAGERLRQELKGSYLWQTGGRFLQDPLCFRCLPNLMGVLRQRLQHLTDLLVAHCNTVSDNPVVLGDDGRILSNAFFDTTALSLATAGVVEAFSRWAQAAERRIDKHLSESFSGLPTGLGATPTSYGLGILNHTAASLAATVASEAVGLVPQLAPVAEGVEDVGSMTPWALEKLERILRQVELLAAAEAVVAAQAALLRGTTPLAKADLCRGVLEASERHRLPGAKVSVVADLLGVTRLG